jgi:hypothetical protein
MVLSMSTDKEVFQLIAEYLEVSRGAYNQENELDNLFSIASLEKGR